MGQIKQHLHTALTLSVLCTSAFTALHASAQEAAPRDGGRFRFGIDGAGAFESVSPLSGPMFGLDLRLGYQINDMFAVYAQPHLSLGSLSSGAVSGLTGTFVGTVMAEATFSDRFFVGAGAGYGILNNPSGPAIEARVGGYPLMSHHDADRSGLMLGVDVKTVFASAATGVVVMGCIGYESF
ncbi:MAG: hypothetical protein U1E65_01165 [Myxococcota bacterium]